MPVTPTYPGVYIEELPSGVRTIAGVATSITAFIGRAARGPVNEPTIINNFGDFERLFGGLRAKLPMTYAVRDYFLNGGATAVIVRLYAQPDGDGVNARASLILEELTLDAAYEGAWANRLRARVTSLAASDEPPAWVDQDEELQKADVFNLLVHDEATDTTESFINVTLKESPRRLDRVLENASNLVRVANDLDTENIAVPVAHPDPSPGADVWATNDPATNVPVAEADKAAQSAPLSATDYTESEAAKTGIYALEKTDLFNLLCIPPDMRGGTTDNTIYQAALPYCVKRRAMLIVDPPAEWSANPAQAAPNAKDGFANLGLSGTDARNAALYFPRVQKADPLRDGQMDTFVPCGIVAGVMARTDVQRGVWKAPAGLDAAINGIQGLEVNLTDPENGLLNPLGINCLRTFPVAGSVVWGARTMRGADQLADEYKYVPVRRLVLYLEESLYRGTQWAVFEPNDEPLWASLRLSISAFMNNLFRQGAFKGSSPKEAYFVKVDSETTTQNDINLGIVNVIIGFAPLKPAEFVILKFQQMAGAVDA